MQRLLAQLVEHRSGGRHALEQLQEAGHLVPSSKRQRRAASRGRKHAASTVHDGSGATANKSCQMAAEDMKCTQARWGRKGGGAPRARAGPLGPQGSRGHIGGGGSPPQGPRGHRELLVAPGTQGARRDAGDAIPEGSRECGQGRCGRKIGGAPGMRGGRLWPQQGRGPWNARREAEALT